jgi:hypothetical protein
MKNRRQMIGEPGTRVDVENPQTRINTGFQRFSTPHKPLQLVYPIEVLGTVATGIYIRVLTKYEKRVILVNDEYT